MLLKKKAAIFFFNEVKLIYLILIYLCGLNIVISSYSKYFILFGLDNAMYVYLIEGLVFVLRALNLIYVTKVKLFEGVVYSLLLILFLAFC